MVSIYDSGKWIENRLDNIFQSTIKDHLDVVCINANSPDPLDNEIPLRYPCRYVKLDSDLSLYDTWNMIIRFTTSPYITNANTDDIVAPQAYEKLLKVLESDEKIACVYPSWHTTHLDNLKWSDTANKDKCHQNGGQPGEFRGDVGTASPGHFPMWRRDLHDQIGLFNPKYTALADANFWVRAYFKTNKLFRWHREPLGCYLWRDGQNLWSRKISSEQWQMFHNETNELKSKSSRK